MADNNQYKIQLGVDLDTSDLQTQINRAGDNIKPIEIKVDAETKELTRTINEALKSLSNGSKNALTLDTSKLEASLKDVTSTIKDIKISIGSLDSNSGMKSLLSSINQISVALEKASNKFEELTADLKSLSGKDFNVNLGINLGGSNPTARNSAYSSKVQSETLPQLKQQAKALQNYFKEYYKVKDEISAIMKLAPNRGGDILDLYNPMSGWKSKNEKESWSNQINAYKQYINIIKEASSLRGIDISHITSEFSKSADQLVQDAFDVQSGAQEMNNSFEKLKQVFGAGGIDITGLSASLEPIIADLGEIRKAIQDLSKGFSLDGLTASFDKLSDSIENLLANAEKVRGVLNSNLGNSYAGGTSTVDTTPIKSAQQIGQKIGETVTKSAQQSINLDDVIDKQVTDLMEKYAIAGEKGSDSFNKIKQALLECRNELEIIKNGNFDIDEQAFGNSAAIDKVTNALSEQMRVANETVEIHGKLADYIKKYNTGGYKVHLPDSVKQEYGDDYVRMARTLGSAFTTGKGQDFESFIEDLNNELGETISLSNGAEAAFKQLHDEVVYDRAQAKTHGKKKETLLSEDELFDRNYLNREEVYDDTISAINVISDAEQKIAQFSTQAANTVVQNEERKQQVYHESSGVIENLKTTLKTMRVDRSSIDAIIQDMEELGFTAKNTSVEMKNGKFDITVNGIDDIGRAITEIRRFDSATDEISLVGRKISQPLTETDKFIKQQKKSVADLTNQINQLNRSAIDQNANRPIKDSTHLDVLEGKYNEITSAIQRMGNASSNTFDEEANNVRTLISEYKSLIKEFRNAENVSSKMKGTDFESGLDIAKNDLEKFKAQAKDFPQITATVKELDNAIEGVGNVSSLNKFNDQLRVARSELAKVKAETIAANRRENVGIDVSGATSRIADIQRISPEINEFKAKINGAEVSVESLLSDLSKVNTAGDFSVVNHKLRAFTDAAKAAGIAVTETVTKSAQIEEIKQEMANFVKLHKQIDNLKLEIGKLETVGGNDNKIAELKNQLKELEDVYDRLSKKSFDNFDMVPDADVKKFNDEIIASTQRVEKELAEFKSHYADTRAELAKKIEINLNAGEFSTKVQKVESNINNLSNATKELRLKLDVLKTAESTMNSAFKNGSVEERIKAWEDYKRALKDVENQYQRNKIAENNAFDSNKLKLSKEALSSDMKSWLRDNSAAAKQFGDTIRQLQSRLEACDNGVDFDNIKAEFRNVTKEAKALGLTGQTTFDKLKTKFKEYASYLSAAEVFMYAEQGLRSMFEQVKLIDSAMTELKKVTDETDAAYNQFLTNAASRAKEIGTTIDGLASSTADFAKLGYEFEEAQGLAEVANIYAVVGDEINGVEGATESLVSTLAAFKGEMNGLSDSDFALSIIDKMNEVANQYSISSGGIGEALKRAASSLSTSNNTLDESISLITAANEVVQDPERVGNAMKTISMRIRSAKSELQEMGEDTDGVVESTATLRAEIKALSGVDIMASATEFKSTYQILDELSQKWENLSDITQATIIEKMAGKHQGNIFSSLMENFDTARAALETSLNSSGSALKEHERWSQSLEARLNSLAASWQALSQTFLSSDFLKSALGGVIGLVDGITALIDTLGTLPTLALALTAFESFKGIGIFKTIEDEASLSGKKITNIFTETARQSTKTFQSIGLKTDSSFKMSLDDDIRYLNEYLDKTKNNAKLSATAFDDIFKNASISAKKFAQDGKLATEGISGFIQAQKEAQVSILAQNKSLGNAIGIIREYYSGCKNVKMSQESFASSVSKTNPELGKQLSTAKSAKGAFAGYATSLIGAKVATVALEVATMAMNAAITMGVSAIISLLVKALDEAIVTSSELAEQVDEITSKFKEQHEELRKLKGDYDTSNESSMISKYEKLSKGVDSLGRNVSLTADEYSEYQSIVNKIADQIPSVVSGYDQQGNAILSCKDNVEELTEAYEKLIHAQNSDILGNAGKIEENYRNTANDIDSSGWSTFWQRFLPGGRTGYELNKDSIEFLEDVYSGKLNDVDEIKNLLEGNTIVSSGGNKRLKIGEALKQSGVEFIDGSLSKTLVHLMKTDSSKIKRIIDDYYTQFDEIVEQGKSIGLAKLSEAFDVGSEISGLDYGNISEDLQAIAYQVVGNLDKDFFNKLQSDGKTIEQWTTEMLDQLNSIGKDGNDKIETAFNLKTQFNDGDVTYGEYAKGIQEAKNIIDGLELDEEVKNTIKLSFDDKDIQTQYNHIRGYLRDLNVISPDNYVSLTDMRRDIERANLNIDYFLDSLTADELAAVIDIKTEIDWANTSAEDIRKQIADRVKLNEALNFEANIEADTTALETLNEILTESASAMGLSSDAIDSLTKKYSSLDSFDPSTLFEATGNGIKVNREELEKLEKEYNDLTKTEVKEHLDTLVDKYNDVTAEIDKCTNAGERAELLAERETYADKIEELATYQAQLEGVTGAYQDWINAQNTPEDYEGYESVATSREDIEDEIDRGFIGNSTKKYIDLLSGEDLDGKSVDDYAEAWEKLDKNVTGAGYSVNDFFTVNDDGDITSTGIDRFFKSLQTDFEGSVAKFDDKTKKWSYDFGAENLEKIKEKWGIGIEAIELLLEAAVSAGYDVDWGGILDGIDLDTSSFETLVSAAEAAQTAYNKIEGLEDVNFNFTATGVEEAESEIEKARQAFSKFINEDGTVNLKADGAEEMQFILTTLIIQKQQLSTPAIMKVDTSQIDKAKTDVTEVINAAQTLQSAYENYEIAISTGVNVEGAKKDLDSAIKGMKGTSVDVRADLKLPTDADLEAARKSIGNIKVGATLDGTSIGAIATQIQTQCTPKVIAEVTGIDESAITNGEGGRKVKYTPEHSEVDAYINGLKDINKKIIFKYTTEGTKPNPKNIERTITYEYKTTGEKPKAYGTAHSNGSASGRAFARGNWGIKGNGVALGGELAPELLVRQGKWHLIGQNGAEFFNYKHNDIIFNAEQTRQLFKYGGIKGAKPRGTMLANGSAFAEGTYPSSGEAFWNASATTSKFAKNRLSRVGADGSSEEVKNTSTKKKKSTSSKGGLTVNTKTEVNNGNVSSETSARWSANANESDWASNRSENNGNKTTKEDVKEFEEVFDWIETAISRIEREIDNLDRTANNVYKSWSDRNKALASEISKVSEEIKLQNNAAQEYLKKANSVGLDETWAKKVRNGALDIDTLNQDNSNEELVEKIKNYQKWYELYLDCTDATEELREEESKLYAQRFENVQAQYDSILQGYEHTESMLNEYISQAEAQGHIVSKNYYNALIANEKKNIDTLKREQAELIAERDKAVAEGKIVKGSEAWYDQCQAIDEVTQEIESGTTALIEYNNAIREIEWETFDLIQERISDITAEADFLIELMSHKNLFDDKGSFTNQGTATVGLHAQNYNTYMYQSDDLGKEISEIDKQLAKAYSKELEERRRELISQQREMILNAEQEKEAIRDLVSEGIELELEALDERIQKYQDGLDAAKDLYDYQKRVEEQTSEIGSLQKQLSAYEGDNSEEAKAKIQELRVSLEEAEANLEETEYDKYISDQQKLLDELFLEYETILNERIDNIDFLLQQVIDGINAAAGAEGTITSALGADGVIAKLLGSNTTTIGQTLKTEVSNVGTTLSEAMKNIWIGDGSGKAVIDLYGKGFQDKQTTTNDALNSIKSNVSAMVDDIDKDAKKKIEQPKTQTAAIADPTKNAGNNTSKDNNGNKDPKREITNDTLMGIAAAIWNYQKENYGGWGADPDRKKKLTDKLGAENAAKVQSYINSYGATGKLYNIWISNGKNLNKYKYSAFKLGAKNIDESQLAWTQEQGQEYIIRPSDGAILTPVAKGDSVLTSAATNNIWQMANSPAEFIRDNLSLGSTSVPNNATVQNSYVQHLDKVVFSMPNVHNYQEFLAEMQKDKNFERLVESMSIGKLAGKSSLTKGKAIR